MLISPSLPRAPGAAAGIGSGRTLTAPLKLDADVVVVGSGAGGGMLAHKTSAAGLRTVLLEEGGNHTQAEFNQREGDMLPRLFQDAGGRSTGDGAVMILHGRGIGGSTVHNTNLCKRAPDPVLRRWVSEMGARGWSPEELAADYAAVEADLSVALMSEDDVNHNNAIMRRGVQRLGWQGGLLAHNRRGCARSGFCELGCSFNAKQNSQKVLIPKALAHGATVLADMRVTHVLRERDRVTGVRGHSVRADGGRGVEFVVRARAVCLCASAIGSAALLRHSDLPDPYAVAGRSLRLHPGVAVAGQFDEVIEAWLGVPQSFECTEKLRFEPGAADRSWLIPAFAHPGGYAGLQPGFGPAHAEQMRAYPRTAVVAAMLHDETRGEVGADRHGRPKLRYELSPDDAAALWRGVHAAAEILLAAGARQVMVPLGTPLIARTTAELAPLLRHRYRPLDPILTSVHPMGSLPLGSDPRRSVVDPDGRHHQVQGLYVADGSVFPTSIGGPPQLSIYATGRKVARTVCADLGRSGP
jgi:choline dehydrogenase-like flavoprotein